MTKRMKAAERRASIMAVAKVLFADKGYHGVSVDELARRVGVSPAVLYQHFGSKEELYEAVVDGLSASRETYIEAALDGPDDFPSVLRRITRVSVEHIAADPDLFRMELQASLESAETARCFFHSRWQAIADYIEYSRRELALEKGVRVINERVAALMFIGLMREAVYDKCILDAERYEAFTLDELTRQLIDLFLHAIDYRPAKTG